MSTKYLGSENILRSAFDPTSESLRTTAVASFAGGTVSLVISDTTDSIKIGNGVGQFLAINNDGSINANITGSINVNIDASTGDNVAISDGTDTVDVASDGSLSVNTVHNPLITNIPLALANTEYSFSVNASSKRFLMQLRE